MPHVDEGTLHAYLDGELPSSEHDGVEAHFAQCPTCRAHLVEERALLERASALLGATRPVERPAPPLDELRRTAPARRSPWRVRTSFAWAASIALALGVGYVLRGGGGGSGAAPDTVGYTALQTQRLTEDKPAAPPAPSGTAARNQERPALAGRFSERQLQAPSADVAAAAEKSRADSVAPQGAEAAAGVLALKTAPQLPAATAARQREADSLVAVQRAANSLVTAQEEAVVTAPPPQPSAALRGRATTTQWPIISRGAARSLLGTEPVGLPGLARKIRRNPANDGTVLVEQQIDSGTTIQIFQRQNATAGFAYDSAVPSERFFSKERAIAPADRLARYVGRLRVEIAGPLSTDSLNKLLNQVQPLP